MPVVQTEKEGDGVCWCVCVALWGWTTGIQVMECKAVMLQPCL